MDPRLAAVLLVLPAGCKQVFGLANPELRAADAPTNADVRRFDGASTLDIGVPPDLAAPACGTSDAALVLCLEFNEAGLATATTAVDSSPAHNDAAISDITVTTRDVPTTSQAIDVTSSSSVTVAASSDFGSTKYTTSAWFNISGSAPPGPQAGIVGTSTYGLDIQGNNGRAMCTIETNHGNFQVTGTLQLPSGTWGFAACTYDGMQLCVYNGATATDLEQASCMQPGGALTASSSILDVGSEPQGLEPFTGGVDSVCVFTRALTAAEVCAESGVSGC
jgi:hypothetical protein